MVNKIYILDSKKINDTTYIVRLIKRYHITLLDIFPKVLESIIRSYVDDIVDVIINEHDIIVDDQYINCNSISFSFEYCIDEDLFNLTGVTLKCDNISNNIVNIFDENIYRFNYMWKHISNEYFNKLYSYTNLYYYIGITGDDAEYTKNILRYNNKKIFEIRNHKLFKNIIIIIHILNKYILKKLKL